jgi:HD-like signal output (HDOD) protein
MGWLSNLVARRRQQPTETPAAAPRPRASQPVTTFSQLVAQVALPAAPACAPEVVAAAAAQVLAHLEEDRSGFVSFPNMAARIMDILALPEPDFNRLVQALGQDVAITAKLLQVANSALHARGEVVETVRAAVVKLGLREVGQLAIGIAGRSLFETSSRVEYSLFPAAWERLFHDAMSAAFTAGKVSMSARVGRSDSAFLAGMLHDIGKPIALHALATLMLAGKLDRNVLDGGIDAVLERVHVQIGTAQTADWSLPDHLRAAAARHHDLELPADAPDEVHIVRVVDGLRALRAAAISEDERRVLRASAAALRLDHRMMRVLATEHAELARRVTELFGVADPIGPGTRRAA